MVQELESGRIQVDFLSREFLSGSNRNLHRFLTRFWNFLGNIEEK